MKKFYVEVLPTLSQEEGKEFLEKYGVVKESKDNCHVIEIEESRIEELWCQAEVLFLLWRN